GGVVAGRLLHVEAGRREEARVIDCVDEEVSGTGHADPPSSSQEREYSLSSSGSAVFATWSGRNVSTMTASSSVHFLPIDASARPGTAGVARAERADCQERAVVVAVAGRHPDRPRALEDQERVGSGPQPVPMKDSARDDEVVALAEGKIAHQRLQDTLALADID